METQDAIKSEKAKSLVPKLYIQPGGKTNWLEFIKHLSAYLTISYGSISRIATAFEYPKPIYSELASIQSEAHLLTSQEPSEEELEQFQRDVKNLRKRQQDENFKQATKIQSMKATVYENYFYLQVH